MCYQSSVNNGRQEEIVTETTIVFAKSLADIQLEIISAKWKNRAK